MSMTDVEFSIKCIRRNFEKMESIIEKLEAKVGNLENKIMQLENN